MSDSVDLKDVVDLKTRLNHEGIKLRFKKNGYPVWWHWIVAKVATLFLWLFTDKDFEKDFWTQIGSTIYCPVDGDYIDLRNLRNYRLICHELAHYYRKKRLGFKYTLGWLLSRKKRAYEEYIGYGNDLIARKRVTGELNSTHYIWMKSHFTGPNYGWMHPDHGAVSKNFYNIAKAINEGKLTGYDPKDQPWDDIIEI